MVATRYAHVENSGAAVEPREALHDGDEGFLSGISAVGLRSGDPAAERVDALVVAAQERFHRGAIAGLRRGHGSRSSATVVMGGL